MIKPAPLVLAPPDLPTEMARSSLVRTFDRIRFDLDDREDEEYAEFLWFAREYPRFYRHHLGAAAHRLETIHQRYADAAAELGREAILRDDEGWRYAREGVERLYGELAISTPNIYGIYWDFEAFLGSVSTGLDLLARIVGTAYPQPTPPSFNRLCQRAPSAEITTLLQRAQRRWVARMKDYRDCFTHYTPVDSLLFLSAYPTPCGYRLWIKIPTNPNVRESLAFRYSRRLDVLRYAIALMRNLRALEGAVARMLLGMYRDRSYPARTSNLFFVGARFRETERPSQTEALSRPTHSAAGPGTLEDLPRRSVGSRLAHVDPRRR